MKNIEKSQNVQEIYTIKIYDTHTKKTKAMKKNQYKKNFTQCHLMSLH